VKPPLRGVLSLSSRVLLLLLLLAACGDSDSADRPPQSDVVPTSASAGDNDPEPSETPTIETGQPEVDDGPDDQGPDADGPDQPGFSLENWPSTPVLGTGEPVGVDDSGTPGLSLGRIAVPETSALMASRTEDGVYWTIQDRADGEDRAALLGIRIVDGDLDATYGDDGLRTVSVNDVANVDWETLAPGPDGTLLIGDLGNNDCRRSDQKVLQIQEPGPADPEADGDGDGDVANLVARLLVDFPDTAEVCGGKNAEASISLDGSYILLAKTEPPVLYRLKDPVDGDNLLERLGPIAQPAGGFDKLVTGMSINDDQTRVVVTTAGERFWVYETSDDVLESLATTPPRWSRRYDATVADTQIEGAAFVPGTDDIVLIGENRSVWSWPSDIYEEGVLER